MKKIVLLLVTLTLTATNASAGRFQAAAQGGVQDVYTVVLRPNVARNPNSARVDLPTVAEVAGDLAKRFGGRIEEVWEHALHGFVIQMPEARARALARDSRVLAAEQDFEIAAPVGDCYYGNTWIDLRPLPSNSVSPQTLTCSDPDPLNDPNPNDPNASPLCQDNWGLDRIDQRSSVQAQDEKYFFAKTGRAGGTTVHIYVLDTGIRASHDEFKDSFGSSRVIGGADARNNPVDDSPAADTGDCYGHGTHVAGIIAGRTYGVAKDAILHSVRIIGCANISISTFKTNVIRALNWIVGHAAYPAVINWSGGNSTATVNDTSVQSAVQGVLSSGIILVQAAGNQSPDYDSTRPEFLRSACTWSFGGQFPDVIVAGGMDEYDGRWTRRPAQDGDDVRYCPDPYNAFSIGDCGSNAGPCIDLWAPAAHVVSSSMDGDSLACRLSGTSMAAPHVTGAVALYLQDNPSATATQVNTALRSIGTWGVLQSYNLHPNWIGNSDNVVLFSYKDQPPIANFTFSCSSLSCTFTNTSTDDQGFTSSWTFGDSSSAGTLNASHTYVASGHYTVTLTVTDTLGAQASKSRMIPVSDQPLEFGVQQLGLYIGGTAGAVTDAQMIPADFNGDGYDDVLVFRSSDGSYRKWYGGSGVTQGFSEQPLRYLGGAPGAVPGAQMIPADFNGDGKTDFLVFRSSNGAYWKWYGDPGAPYPDFAYQPGRYIGGSPGAVPDAQMIPADLNGDGKTDFIVFRPSNGAYWKWYGDPGAPYPDFVFQLGRYIDGAPGAVTNAQMIPADFSGDGKSDVLVFRSADGSFRKWYGDTGLPGPDFSTPQTVTYIGGAPGAVTDAQMIPADFDGNGTSDILVFRPATGGFWKWYGDTGAPYPHFGYQLGRYANDAPGEVTGAQMISADFNGDLRSDFLVFRSSDGAFWKWYSLGANIGSDFIYAYAPRYLGGSPGAVSNALMIPADFNGDGKTDILVFRPSNGAYWKWYGP